MIIGKNGNVVLALYNEARIKMTNDLLPVIRGTRVSPLLNSIAPFHPRGKEQFCQILRGSVLEFLEDFGEDGTGVRKPMEILARERKGTADRIFLSSRARPRMTWNQPVLASLTSQSGQFSTSITGRR